MSFLFFYLQELTRTITVVITAKSIQNNLDFRLQHVKRFSFLFFPNSCLIFALKFDIDSIKRRVHRHRKQSVDQVELLVSCVHLRLSRFRLYSEISAVPSLSVLPLPPFSKGFPAGSEPRIQMAAARGQRSTYRAGVTRSSGVRAVAVETFTHSRVLFLLPLGSGAGKATWKATPVMRMRSKTRTVDPRRRTSCVVDSTAVVLVSFSGAALLLASSAPGFSS